MGNLEKILWHVLYHVFFGGRGSAHGAFGVGGLVAFIFGVWAWNADYIPPAWNLLLAGPVLGYIGKRAWDKAIFALADRCGKIVTLYS